MTPSGPRMDRIVLMSASRSTRASFRTVPRRASPSPFPYYACGAGRRARERCPALRPYKRPPQLLVPFYCKDASEVAARTPRSTYPWLATGVPWGDEPSGRARDEQRGDDRHATVRWTREG